jgi:hypothetical protein
MKHSDLNSQTDRLNIKVSKITVTKFDLKGFIKSKLIPKLACEARIEINPEYVMVGYIESFVQGEKYGKELLNYIISKYPNLNIRAYIPKDNTVSKNLFSSCGFKEIQPKENGSFWELTR